MAAQTTMTIRVKTEQLVTVAGSVEAKIQRLERVFSDIEQSINTSRQFWEGDGVSAFLVAYRSKQDTIKTTFQRFRENVEDLREIAGVYEQAEHTAAEKNATLTTAGIV